MTDQNNHREALSCVRSGETRSGSCIKRLLRQQRAGPTSWLLALAAFAVGCQTYEPRPLDLSGREAAFLARRADDSAVQSFAARLGERAARDDAMRSGGHMLFNPSDGITLDEAEVIALVFSADLRVARQRALLCMACVGAAGAWEDPIFELDLAKIVESVAEPWKIGAGVRLSVPISGRLKLEKLHAEAEQVAEVMRAVRAEWELRMRLRRDWTNWTATCEQAELTRGVLDHTDTMLALVSRHEQLGEVNSAKANLIRIERSLLALELERLESSCRSHALGIVRLMGLPPDAATELRPGLPNQSNPAVMTAQTLRLRLLEHHVELAAKSVEYAQAERLLEWEVRKQYPDLELMPGLAEEDGLNEIRLGASIRLPIFARNRRGIAEAKKERDSLYEEVGAIMERLVSDVAIAEERWEAAKRRLDRLQGEVVPMVDEQSRVVRRLLELGETDLVVLFETLQRERQVKGDLVMAHAEVTLAAIDLAELAGPELLALSDPAAVPAEEDSAEHAAAREIAGCACPDCLAKAIERVRREQDTPRGSTNK